MSAEPNRIRTVPFPGNSTARVPESSRSWFRRHGWSTETPTSFELLRAVESPSRLLEDFRPVGTHLDWHLSEHYWATRGVLAFAENHVPHLINNSGQLSTRIARVVLAACEAAPPEDRWSVAELGAGSALFAKLFLDAFRRLCVEHGRDYYDRLTYFATDISPSAVAQWHERELFADHAGRVELAVVSATEELPAQIAPRVVICNYVLDVLPASVLHRTQNGTIEQLVVRTHLNQDAPPHLSAAALRDLVATDSLSARETLLGVSSHFELEVDFRELEHPSADEVEACRDAADLERVLYNREALACVRRILRTVDRNAFLIINDYGPTEREDAARQTAYQYFGSTTAFALNFPLLERLLTERGVNLVKPTGDVQNSLHTRLLSQRPLPDVERSFEANFGAQHRDELAHWSALAREHAQAGRNNPALEAYKAWLQRDPHDWSVIGEAAEFMNSQIRDHAAAVTLAQVAVQLNPAYSTWLWNVLGDALYCLERFEEAHEAYLQAERIHPDDPRTNYNLAFSYLRRGLSRAALDSIARGLAADVDGLYRDRLLQKQREVLTAAANAATSEACRRLRIRQRLEPTEQPPTRTDCLRRDRALP